jgi:hypothetical protein
MNYKESFKAMMESDFDPGHTPDLHACSPERMSKAAEYAAYQLGPDKLESGSVGCLSGEEGCVAPLRHQRGV